MQVGKGEERLHLLMRRRLRAQRCFQRFLRLPDS
jgi:hypothetical protein